MEYNLSDLIRNLLKPVQKLHRFRGLAKQFPNHVCKTNCVTVTVTEILAQSDQAKKKRTKKSSNPSSRKSDIGNG